MKTIKYLFLALNIFVVCGVSAQGIAFRSGNWEAIKAMSAAEKKPIFIDFGTVWCAPCRELVKTIFPQQKVGDFYNKNFVCIQVDAEKGEGVMLARKFRVGGFPTLIYTNAAEKLIYSITGLMSGDKLIEEGKVALIPQDDYADLKARYTEDKLSREELYRYLLIVKTKGNSDDLKAVLDKYVEMKPQLVNLSMFNTIADLVSVPNTKAFTFLEENRAEFSHLAGKDKVEALIRKIYTQGAGYKAYKDEQEYQTAMEIIDRKIHLTEQERLKIEVDRSGTVKDKDRFMKAAKILAEKYYQNDDEALSLLLGTLYSFNLSKDDLLVFKSWAERALAIQNNSLNALSLAMVYKQLKNKEMALKYVNLAIANSLRDKDNEEGHLAVFKKQIEEASY